MTDGSSFLANLGDLSKPVTKLVESISEAVGVLYEPRRIRKRAEAEADALVIKAKAEVEVENIAARAARRLTKVEIRRQQNIESIVQMSSEALPAEVAEEPVSEDWIARFFEAAKDVGDKEVQLLWAKILAGEVASPGTFSLRTMDILRVIDRNDAKRFELIANYAVRWDGDELYFIPFTRATEYYFKTNGFSVKDASDLISLGLLQDGLVQSLGPGYTGELIYIDESLCVRNASPASNSFGTWHLSNVGAELYPLCNVSMDEKYISELTEGLVEEGFKVDENMSG
ncbi:MAG: DUF2806 domain-containing protein [Planctomycetota bacterium]|jgi:hypothetical protein